MASSCISRFITEVAPPRIVCVVRRRVSSRDAAEAKPSSSKGVSCFPREERPFSIYSQGWTSAK
ncbi:hypothetical protein AAC387_Pa02g1982 [Persea americana]